MRAGGLALLLSVLGLFAAGVPPRARQLATIIADDELVFLAGLPPAMAATYTSRLGPAEAEALQGLGLSIPVYAAWVLAFELGLALACAAVGLFIFWRRSAGWLALWVALLLVLLGTTAVSPEIYILASSGAGREMLPAGVGLLGMIIFLHFLYLAPDGRFVPPATGRLAAGFTGASVALGAYFITVAQRGNLLAYLIYFLVAVAAWLILSAVGIGSQVYRYRRISGPVERQQIKWVAVGLAAVTLGIALNGALLLGASQAAGQARLLYSLTRAPLVNLCLLGLPFGLAFSILRYRLWDIDLIIRRTLIYASLTAALVAVYFGSVVLLQALVGRLTGQNRSELVTVLSTLAIAALFVSLRRRVQDFIDRRFYRRKYDAAQVLAAFGASLRDETDLARLSRRLEAVVDQTMQPASAGLWLRPPRD